MLLLKFGMEIDNKKRIITKQKARLHTKYDLAASISLSNSPRYMYLHASIAFVLVKDR